MDITWIAFAMGVGGAAFGAAAAFLWLRRQPATQRSRNKTPEAAPDRRMKYGPRLVILIDVLGQGEELLKLESIPMVPEQQEATLAILRDTAGRVKIIREWFTSFFEGLSRSRRPVDDLPQHVREVYLRFRSMRFGVLTFSDTVVVSVPMFKDEELGFVKSAETLWAALMAVANVMLTAMAAGIPLRAGIEIGNGLDVSDNEVYGPVLARAYRLESKIAQYPRAAVGDGLLRYLRFLAAQPDAGPWAGLAAERAAACAQLICDAPDDGVKMLHVLASEVLQCGPNHHELPPRAVAWIGEQVAKHEAAGNNELGDRYRRLLRYFESNGYMSSPATVSSIVGN